MTPDRGDAGERHAARLLRWYPAAWRARYGAEFTELLLADPQDAEDDQGLFSLIYTT